ncbi:MAG: phosphatase PAP2 family protein [Actinomycetota bacterium]
MTDSPNPAEREATEVVDRQSGSGSAPAGTRISPRLRWWFEVLFVLAFYAVYTSIRNGLSAGPDAADLAFRNAERIIDLEKLIGLFQEERIQSWFLDYDHFIRFWNVFYGTLHFAVTIFAMVWTYRRYPNRYPLWRNTLACTTGLALVGFTLFPLMPPRLLDAGPPFGAGQSYGFVDTLAEYGGLWSFDSGTMAQISNQYAAMPSLHFAWALWCFFVLYRYLPWRWARIAIAVYPWATLFAIIVTGNHYWLDAVGGALVLGAGFLIAQPLTRQLNAWRVRRVRAAQAARGDDSSGEPIGTEPG